LVIKGNEKADRLAQSAIKNGGPIEIIDLEISENNAKIQNYIVYLNNRNQFVSVNGVHSEMFSSSYGVPQGSILGPLLFLIYINDINEAIPGEKIKLFADDSNLFVQGPDIRNVSDRANLMLAKLHIWFIANKLTL